jgi:hypothetical protein
MERESKAIILNINIKTSERQIINYKHWEFGKKKQTTW